MKQDNVYLCYIRDAIDKIGSYTSVGKKDFFETCHWQNAVIRNLEIIGEATKRLSAELKSKNPGIPWRDVLIHDNMGVDLHIVWNVVTQDLPK